jgi:Fatty-acid desaturase
MMNLKNVSKYAWFSFTPFVTGAFITIGLIATGMINPLYLCITFIMWCLISGLGVAVGYHRVFSHRTHKLPVWKENVILFLGTLSGQGSSITWSAIHRGYHHRWSDTDRDLHSPTKGMWHAFFGWALKITEASNIINMRYAVDLLRKPNHVWFHRHQMKILWLTPLCVAVFDWRLSLTAVVLPAGISLLQDNMVNILGHRRGLNGYRNVNTDDMSYNHRFLSLLTWGQLLHNNHHAEPALFDFAFNK